MKVPDRKLSYGEIKNKLRLSDLWSRSRNNSRINDSEHWKWYNRTVNRSK